MAGLGTALVSLVTGAGAGALPGAATVAASTGASLGTFTVGAAGVSAAAAGTAAAAAGGVSLGTLASVAGTTVSAVSAIAEGRAAKRAAEFNARVAEREAAATKERSAFEEARSRRRTRSFLSTQRALFGASGVNLAGSPLRVLEETASEGELEALAIRFGGDIASTRALSQAAVSRFAGSQAERAGFLRAGTTLLTGGGRSIRRRK